MSEIVEASMAGVVHGLIARVDEVLADSVAGDGRLSTPLVALRDPLTMLDARLSAAEEKVEIDAADKALIRHAVYLTSREYLCGLDETVYSGGCPEELELFGFPCPVPRGLGGWGTAEQTFLVRGKDYLKDEVKVLSMSPLFYTRGLQMFKIPTLTQHVASMPWCPIPRGDGQEWLVVNYMVPGNPPIQVVCFYCATQEALDVLHEGHLHQPAPASPPPAAAVAEATSPSKKSKGPQQAVGDGWKLALRKFWECDKSDCDQRFKLIPNVVHGPWPLKMAIGSKPALTGTKLAQSYYRGENYLEIDIDIGSSSVAANILSLVRDGSKRLTLDIAIAIQGNAAEELPERVLCQTRWAEMDFGKAGVLPPTAS